MVSNFQKPRVLYPESRLDDDPPANLGAENTQDNPPECRERQEGIPRQGEADQEPYRPDNPWSRIIAGIFESRKVGYLIWPHGYTTSTFVGLEPPNAQSYPSAIWRPTTDQPNRFSIKSCPRIPI